MNPIEVKQSVRDCNRCHLVKTCTHPVPFLGPAPNDLVVIGEAPGEVEDRVGLPFVGPAGQFARRSMFEQGLNADQFTWLNVVSCYPGRTPSESEIKACRINLRNQLTVISPTHCLMFGGVAVTAFWPKEKISDIHGLWWRLDGKQGPWVMATWHPSAVLRNRKLEAEFIEDLCGFKLSLREGVTWNPDDCCMCKQPADLQVRGISYCWKHQPRAMELGIGTGRRQ